MMTSGYNTRDLVQEAQVRWLKPAEVLFILQNYEENQLTHEPPQKPPSGSLFLFNKRVLRFFRKDGHSWRRKRDGRAVGEAHERLKVGNMEALNCYYAHGEENPNFQRRSYWMLDSAMEHIVLVHYRDITVGRHNTGPASTLSPGSTSSLVQSSNSYATQFTQSTAVSGFGEPYDNTSSPSSVEVSSDVYSQSNGTSFLNQTLKTEEIGSLPDFKIDQALRRIEEQLSLDDDQLKDIGAFYGENENSTDSGFTRNEQICSKSAGMLSNNYVPEHVTGDYGTVNDYQQQFVDETQETIWNNMLNNGYAAGGGSQETQMYSLDKNGLLLSQPRRNTVQEQQKYPSRDTGLNNDQSTLLPEDLENFKFPTFVPARNVYQTDQAFYSTLFDQAQTGMPLESDPSLTIAQEQKFTIREISPDWGYAHEQTKVLIIGRFTCHPSNHEWTCMFGDTEVPVEIIQEGVICCQAPPRLPGKVTLCITSGNRQSCSEVREFEFRDKPSSLHTNLTEKDLFRSSEELLLLVRFVQMLLSAQVREKGENTKTNLLDSSMAGEDSWAQVIEALLDGSLASSSTIDWLLEELLKDKLQQWLWSRSQDPDSLPNFSKREQGIIHMVCGLGFGWALTPILNAGINVNFRDINGWTPLHWAARFGREKMVAQLIASGAYAGAVTDPCQQDPAGKTPASIAADSGHKGLAGYLSELALTSHLSSLTLQESELSKSSADVEAERTINSIPRPNLVVDEDQLSLKDTLAAVRTAAQAAARIQSAFRAHSFRKRLEKESAAYSSGDEYGILPSDIEGLSAASKLTFRNARDHNAALSIQKKYRGWKGRKDFLAIRQKIVKIQAHVRGHQVRKNYKVICWAVGIVEKVVLRWRRKGAGLRGFRQESESLDSSEDEDIVKAFRKQKVDVAIGEAVSRVLSMVNSQQARQQYRRMLQKYREAKAERGDLEIEVPSTSQGDASNMENDDLLAFM